MPTTLDTFCACRCHCQEQAIITLLGQTRSAIAAACTGTDTHIFTHRNGLETSETCPGEHAGSSPETLAAAALAEARAQPWVAGTGDSIYRLEPTRAEYREGRFQLVLSIPIAQAPPIAATISGGWINWRGVPFAEAVVAEGRATLAWAEDALEHRVFRSEWLEVENAGEGEWSYIELTAPRGICLDGWG